MFMYKEHFSGQAPNCMDDFKVVSITNREICPVPLPDQIDKLCHLGVKDFILREKDLSPDEYAHLAVQVLKVCEKHGANLVLHSFWQTVTSPLTEGFTFNKIHFPLWLLERDYRQIKAAGFTDIGCSCHSIEEAQKAIELGATYITASHIYPTDCKKGLAPRGLEFLKEICDFIKSQKSDEFCVYALGGIKTDGSQFKELKQAGAAGACLMSGLMKI